MPTFNSIEIVGVIIGFISLGCCIVALGYVANLTLVRKSNFLAILAGTMVMLSVAELCYLLRLFLLFNAWLFIVINWCGGIASTILIESNIFLLQKLVARNRPWSIGMAITKYLIWFLFVVLELPIMAEYILYDPQHMSPTWEMIFECSTLYFPIMIVADFTLCILTARFMVRHASLTKELKNPNATPLTEGSSKVEQTMLSRPLKIVIGWMIFFDLLGFLAGGAAPLFGSDAASSGAADSIQGAVIGFHGALNILFLNRLQTLLKK